MPKRGNPGKQIRVSRGTKIRGNSKRGKSANGERPEDEIIEPLIGDSIDIGEAVAQQLSVAMDPYPRAVGAQSSTASAKAGLVEGDEAGAPMARRNPFDALAVLKKQS